MLIYCFDHCTMVGICNVTVGEARWSVPGSSLFYVCSSSISFKLFQSKKLFKSNIGVTKWSLLLGCHWSIRVSLCVFANLGTERSRGIVFFKDTLWAVFLKPVSTHCHSYLHKFGLHSVILSQLLPVPLDDLWRGKFHKARPPLSKGVSWWQSVCDLNIQTKTVKVFRSH